VTLLMLHVAVLCSRLCSLRTQMPPGSLTALAAPRALQHVLAPPAFVDVR
jgi:hypothetical protein